MPVPVAKRSKACVYGRSLAGTAGSNPVGGMDGCPLWVLCVLSGRGLCDELITRPEESYRLCRVIVCDLGTSRVSEFQHYTMLYSKFNTSLVSSLNLTKTLKRE